MYRSEPLIETLLWVKDFGSHGKDGKMRVESRMEFIERRRRVEREREKGSVCLFVVVSKIPFFFRCFFFLSSLFG